MLVRRLKSRGRGRGVLLVLSCLLIGSALLRIGGTAGQAVAQALTQPMKPDLGTASKEESTIEQETQSTVDAPIQDRTQVSRLLTTLKKREEKVKALEKQLAMRQKALEVADAEIEKRLLSLQEAEASLRSTLALADGAAEEDLSRLTQVYENMKPKEAAELFETMEPDFAAGFLGRMRPDAAAAVMAGLSPEIAYSISVILAGRNATAPKS